MKNTCVLDTNVVLRYLLADHAEHYQQAAAFMTEVRTEQQLAYLPESVLVECVYVLLKVYQVPRQQIATQLVGLLNYKGFKQDNKPLLREALQRFAAANVDIVDALVYLTAETRGWHYFSFDTDLNKLARKD